MKAEKKHMRMLFELYVVTVLGVSVLTIRLLLPTLFMQAEVRQLNVQHTAAVKELTAAYARIEFLQQRLTRTTTQHQADLATKAAKIQSLQSLAAKKQSDINCLLTTADINEGLMTDLEAQCSSKQQRILELEAAVNRMKQDRDSALQAMQFFRSHKDNTNSLATSCMKPSDQEHEDAALSSQLEPTPQVLQDAGRLCIASHACALWNLADFSRCSVTLGLPVGCQAATCLNCGMCFHVAATSCCCTTTCVSVVSMNLQ